MLDERNGMEQLTQSFQREVFALKGNKEAVRGRHRVDRQQTKGRGAIDKNEVVLSFDFSDALPLIFLRGQTR